MNQPLWTLVAVLVLIAFRRAGGLRLDIWQIVLAGAGVVVVTGQISLVSAWNAIDWEVIGFLAGVFVLGQALLDSGLLYQASVRLMGRVGNADGLVLAILLASGLASAVLMNDTLAVIGTPLVILLARAHHLPPLLLLLALAFGITLGSVMSPIGNPQNLLIALGSGLEQPFHGFLAHLALPTLVNLFLTWGVLRLAFWRHVHGRALIHQVPALSDPALARLARWGMLAMLAAIALNLILAAARAPWQLPLVAIAGAACAPLLLASPRRGHLLVRLDWATLVFFAALFILVRAVWDTGVVQNWLPMQGSSLASVPGVLLGSALLSQLVSNVPLVALALPLLREAAAAPEVFLALAAGSTVAGNLTLMGAASNVIIAQAAERHGEHLGFWRFLAVGVPVTAINLAVYWLFLG